MPHVLVACGIEEISSPLRCLTPNQGRMALSINRTPHAHHTCLSARHARGSHPAPHTSHLASPHPPTTLVVWQHTCVGRPASSLTCSTSRGIRLKGGMTSHHTSSCALPEISPSPV